MKFKYKNILVPVIAGLLSACGSDDNTATSNNSAPVLDTSALETAYSTAFINASVEGQLEWEYNFSETDKLFDNPKGGEKINYMDIDLLTGISDADFNDRLIVKNMKFMWSGPDCGETVKTAIEYADICTPFLEELGLVGVNTVWEQEQEIRKLQNLPVVDTPIYGFDLGQSVVRVTPSEFSPILITGQTAELGLIYTVTDGETELNRRLKITVNGSDNAPEFINLNEYGEPIYKDNDGVTKINIDAPIASASEKSPKIKVNLIQGLFDADKYAVGEMEQQEGDLRNKYDNDHYTIEALNVIGFTEPAGILPGTYTIDEASREGVGKVKYDIIIDPSTYADVLSKGETKVLTFNYIVTDGENEVPRTFEFTIHGANLKNEPFFTDAKISKDVSTTDYPQVFSLLEGVTDPEGDAMKVVNLVRSDDDFYGLDTSAVFTNGVIKLDPYFVANLKAGDTKVISFTYNVSDGELESLEREFAITVTGGQANLLAAADNSDPSVELKSLADGPFSWQWSTANNANATNVLSIDASAAHTGSQGLLSTDTNMYTRLNLDGIKQGLLDNKSTWYFNFFAKQAGAWSTIRTIFNKEGVWDQNDIALQFTTKSTGSTDWVEHTSTVIETPDFFTKDSKFDITFLSNKGVMDDFSLVKYTYLKARDLISEGAFSNGQASGWQVEGDATLTVEEEANRVQGTDDVQYGLKVVGGATASKLYLDSSHFTQGAFKKGLRYIAQFDLKTPTWVKPAIPLNVAVEEEGGNHFTRKLTYAELSATAWNTYALHLNTGSDGTDVQGALNTDPMFKWDDVATRFVINVPAGHTFLIDNIKVFPVPQ